MRVRIGEGGQIIIIYMTIESETHFTMDYVKVERAVIYTKLYYILDAI